MEAEEGLVAEARELFFEVVDRFSEMGALFGGGVAQGDHEFLDGAFLAEVFDFEVFDVFDEFDALEVLLKLGAESVDFTLHRSVSVEFCKARALQEGPTNLR